MKWYIVTYNEFYLYLSNENFKTQRELGWNLSNNNADTTNNRNIKNDNNDNNNNNIDVNNNENNNDNNDKNNN